MKGREQMTVSAAPPPEHGVQAKATQTPEGVAVTLFQ